MALSEILGFGPRIDVRIVLDGEDKREQVEYRVAKDRKERAPLYFDGESVSGKVQRERHAFSGAGLAFPLVVADHRA
ncbi:Vacuolar protein sorting-associated protein 26 [Spiromyces aspiralis]|uniref:Vacuolar protein sorting-associated protein 26 n=1 Tax=Spiromyces aspiralis TaxID=68401 RepID=A0ACC1HYN9_9FUNG|nr:Vacuolar protein sorting-associated protein 26 [Spiromyces aspiralis]